MNTKSKNIVNPEYENLFSFKNKEDKIDHEAQMISYKILSEVEKACDEKKIKKKELAMLVGTSKSYITQLFRGTKQVNTQIMAKFEDVLEMSFEIKIKLNEETHEEFLSKQIPTTVFQSKRLVAKDCVWHMYQCLTGNKETQEIMQNLKSENKVLQNAG